jgi:uncharacterized protein YdhG (YjbR/CyaY superfamily)
VGLGLTSLRPASAPPDKLLRKSSSSRKNAKQPASLVRSYLAGLPAPSRKELKKLRATIRAAAPGAVEGISYGIPTFRLDGRMLIYCAGWRHHSSLYPLTPAVRRAHGSELKGYETSKGTIRFPLEKPLPTGLVRRIVKTRIAELRAKGKR